MQEFFNCVAVLLNIPVVSVIVFLVMVGWSVYSAYAYDRMRRIGWKLAAITTAAILFVTLLSRTKIPSPSVHLIPFSTFQRGQENGDVYCFMVMNVFIFIPLGLSLPYVFRGAARKRVLYTILVGFLLSFFIESMQNVLSIGYADVDDLISNTLGTILGSLAYPISLQLLMKANKKIKTVKTY